MRFATVLLCVFFCVGAPASSAPTKGGLSLDALLERARAASGEPYRYHVVSVSRETHDGRAFEVTTETDGLKYRARSCSKALCTGFYFDGERSYDANFNQTALPLSSRVDALQLTLRAIVSYAFAAPNFRAQGGQLLEREPVLREGRSYRRLAVAPFRGALLDAVVDPVTGLVAGVVSDERHYAFELRDQRRVGGKLMLPYTIALNGAVVERFDTRAIASAPLEAPAGLVPTIASDAAPVTFVKHDRPSDPPIVACTIGNTTTTCLLDTGNSGLSMDLAFAKKLGLSPRGGAFEIGGVGRFVAGLAVAPPLTVAGATYPRAQYVVLNDLHQYGYDVVLGADAFAHARVTIDFAAHRVAIGPESQAAVPSKAARRIPIVFDNFVPLAQVSFGSSVISLAIDTGDVGSITVSRAFASDHPESFAADRSATTDVLGHVARTRFGTGATAELDNVPIRATKDIADTAKGHIGTAFLALSHESMTFDYTHNRIEFGPSDMLDSDRSAAPAQKPASRPRPNPTSTGTGE